MAITTLDPLSALVVIDLQAGIVGLPTVHPMGEIVERCVALVLAFRRSALPVVLVNVAGRPPGRTEQLRVPAAFPPGWTDLIPELGAQPGDHLVTKHTPGAFTNTGLDALLHDLGVTQIVLCGVSTTSGVESTARGAFERGYNVTLAVDAMTDTSAEAHDNSLTRIFPKIGETGSTQAIVDALDRLRA